MNDPLDAETLVRQVLEVAHRLAASTAGGHVSHSQAVSSLYSILKQQPEQIHETLMSLLSDQYDRLREQAAPYALQYAFLMRDIAERLAFPKWVGWTNHDLGKALKKLGRLAEAEDALRRSLQAFEGPFPDFAAVVRGDLGSSLRRQGRLEEAEVFLRQALADAIQSQQVHNELEWRLELGNSLVFQGRNEEALDILDTGRELAIASSKLYHLSAFLTALANIEENLGRFDNCVRLHEEALRISSRLEDPAAQSVDYQNLGNLKHRFGRYTEALESYQQGLQRAREADDQAQQVALTTSIGSLLLSVGKLSDAIPYLEAANQAAEAGGLIYDQLRTLANLAEAHRLQGETEQARELVERSAELSRQHHETRSLVQDLAKLAELHLDDGEPTKAEPLIGEALALVAELKDPWITSSAQWKAAQVMAALDRDPDLVWSHYRAAMEALEESRQHVKEDLDRVGLYSGGKNRLYESAVSWLLSTDRISQAFEIAERGKSRLLLDALSESASEQLSIPDTVATLWKRLDALPTDVAIASLFLTEDELVVFFADPAARDLTCSRKQVSAERLRRWLDRWAALLQPSDDGDFSSNLQEAMEHLRELDELFVGSIRAWLEHRPNVGHLLLVPYGILHNVPIHLAYAEGSSNGKEGGYLGQQVGCSYLPALQLLQPAEAKSPPVDDEVVVVDDPSLEGARKEAALLQEKLQATHLAGPEATLANLTTVAPKARILHLACHGSFEPLRPEASHLVLGQGEILTVATLSQWRLPNLDLVVAAACQSGKTTPVGLDEAMGLTRAWLLAGARVVLNALWDAEDVSSARFMEAFYEEVQEGAGYVQAFREGQSALIQGDEIDQDPRIWGAFILTARSL